MCGIAGVLSLSLPSINVDCTKPMLDKIAHRGPDDAGYLYFNTGSKEKKKSFHKNLTEKKFKKFNSPYSILESDRIEKELHQENFDLYMGHRRLSIIDLSYSGHQPMSDYSKNVWISFNGEIYNFKELRSELKKLEYKFKSNTDTEVIIYAYIEWGIECIKKFNGMFAFSLYDNRKKKFYLCRDRYGIKPLYYHLTKNKTLIYASEIKSILQYKDYKNNIDKEALIEYFTFQNIFTNKTLHQNIHLLEPGHFFEIDILKKNIKKFQYWDFNFSYPEKINDEREYVQELDRLFTQAVKRQLVSDVSIGSYLSGGMDSGSITSIASTHFQKNNSTLKTFTIGFNLSGVSDAELSFDERAKARLLSKKFKTDHYEMILGSRNMEECLSNFTYHLEEPRVGQSYPNYYAAKLASKKTKVVLSGAGGDELFAGYPWRYYKAKENKNFEDYIDKYYYFWQRLIPNKEIQKVFSPIFDDIKNVNTRDIFKNVFKTKTLAKTREEYINLSLYFEAKTFLHGLLVVEDKLSMAHSIETRLPFLDNDLVDFSQKIPVNLKINKFEKNYKIDENEINKVAKTNDGKLIFRKSMKKYIPKTLFSSTKQGFSSPDKSWFMNESLNLVRKKLLDSNSKIYQYLDYNSTKKLINQHIDGKQNRRLLIWSLLNFESWKNIYG